MSPLLDCPTQNFSWALDSLPFQLGFTLRIFVKICLAFQMKLSGWRRQRSANELIPPLKKLKKSKTYNQEEETDALAQKLCFFSLCVLGVQFVRTPPAVAIPSAKLVLHSRMRAAVHQYSLCWRLWWRTVFCHYLLLYSRVCLNTSWAPGCLWGLIIATFCHL